MAVLTGDGGNNLLNGGLDNDEITGRGGDDTLNGFAGRDTLLGGDGRDIISTGVDEAADSVEAGLGDDFVNARARDRLDGGKGSDGFNLSMSGVTLNEDMSGVRSRDLYTFGDGTTITNFEYGSLFLGAGDDVIKVPGFRLLVYGGPGNDELIGNAESNVLDGGSGQSNDSDTLRGGGGIDVLRGGPGDRFDGGADIDFAEVDLGVLTDRLRIDLSPLASGMAVKFAGARLVNVERGIIYGGHARDVMIAGDTDFSFYGGDGDDSLIGGQGENSFSGGAGEDTLRGGGGFDTALYYGAAAGVTIDLNVTAAQDTGGGGVDLLRGIEALLGTEFDDTLFGSKFGNDLQGSYGKDLLAGRAGNDTLYGGDGRDTLIGGLGQDLFLAGSDVDRLVFEKLNDSSVAAPDVITDLETDDVIDLSGIDADSIKAGDQAFTLVAEVGDGRAEMTLTFNGADTYLNLYVDGDDTPDGAVQIYSDLTGYTNFVG